VGTCPRERGINGAEMAMGQQVMGEMGQWYWMGHVGPCSWPQDHTRNHCSCQKKRSSV